MTAALPPMGENIDRCIIIIIICHQPLNVEMVSLQATVISKHPFNWLTTINFLVLVIYNNIIIANSNSIIKFIELLISEHAKTLKNLSVFVDKAFKIRKEALLL